MKYGFVNGYGLMMRVIPTALVLVLLAGLSGCSSNSSTAPSSSAPFSTVDLLVGDGTTAVNGQTLTVNYTGWIYDASLPENKGLLFESSLTSTPFSFVLGNGDVIPGWDKGIPGMKVGGIRRIVIPPSLAYGSTRQGAIPPYATLVFEVTLLDAEDAAAAATTTRIKR